MHLLLKDGSNRDFAPMLIERDGKPRFFIKSSNTIRGAVLADAAALSGDTLVISAMHDNGPAMQSGRVYVFR